MLILVAILILVISIYAQLQHQKGNYKQAVPQEALEDIKEEYKKIRGFQTIDPTETPTEAPKVENETPSSEVGYTKYQNTANASYYDRRVCTGRKYGIDCYTANGEVFNDEDFTLAHKSLAFGTRVLFQYNGNSVTCRVNDRGPFVANREFDLSLGCAKALGIISKGVASVRYEIKKEI